MNEIKLIDANELKNRNNKFIIKHNEALVRAIMEGFNDIIDHTPSCDLKNYDTEIRADERRKFIAFIAEHTRCSTNCENFLNCDGKRCWNKYLNMYEEEQK